MKMWSQAAELARRTPESRNRYVDFLRAVSILLVIFGHWTAAAPFADDEGVLHLSHILGILAWTQGLTWFVQVMPIFFMVGGFSNGISWRAARKSGKSYATWLDARLRRLVWPVLVLLLVWILIGAIAHLRDVHPTMIKEGSQKALIPLWFLAVYVLVVVLVPVSHALWERFGMASFWGFCAIAALVDVAFLAGDVGWIGWTNYLFVWSAVHQLGYAWRDGHLSRPLVTLAWGLGGLVILSALIRWGPYPLSMVGVTGNEVGNTLPPKVTLIALAAAQTGLLLTIQAPMRRWLSRAVPWTAAVLVNGMIMTIYLWHLTAMILMIGLANLLDNRGLGLEPGTGTWWATRPVWLAVLLVALVPLVLLFARFERPPAVPEGATSPPAWRLVLGAGAVCFGLALLAYDGIAGSGWLGLRLWVLALPFAGAALIRRWGRYGGRPSTPESGP